MIAETGQRGRITSIKHALATDNRQALRMCTNQSASYVTLIQFNEGCVWHAFLFSVAAIAASRAHTSKDIQHCVRGESQSHALQLSGGTFIGTAPEGRDINWTAALLSVTESGLTSRLYSFALTCVRVTVL